MKRLLPSIDIDQVISQTGQSTIIGLIPLSELSQSDHWGELFSPLIFSGSGLCLITQGEATIQLNVQTYRISSGGCCIISPHDIVQILSYSDDIEGYLAMIPMALSQEVMLGIPTEYLFDLKMHPQRELGTDHVCHLINLCLEGQRISEQREHPFRQRIIRNYTENVILELIALYNTYRKRLEGKPSRRNIINQHFFALLGEHGQRERRLEFYAERLHLTSRYLSEVISEVSGRSAAQWIADTTILNAKALLSDPNLTALQVSERLHFANASFFSQYFKRHTGQTPSAYQRQIASR